jgi:predicted outer membrane lipoprotein
VTTGPVTVPLVLAMGLSIGGELNVVDGFGVLALASAFPIITVLVFGLIAQAKQHRSLSETENDDTNE